MRLTSKSAPGWKGYCDGKESNDNESIQTNAGIEK